MLPLSTPLLIFSERDKTSNLVLGSSTARRSDFQSVLVAKARGSFSFFQSMRNQRATKEVISGSQVRALLGSPELANDLRQVPMNIGPAAFHL